MQTALMIPTVDISHLRPGSANWDNARQQVMASLETYGCVEVLDDRITPKLLDEQLWPAMDSVFTLPLEKKMTIPQDNSSIPYRGYINGVYGMDYESVPIPGAHTKDGVERFAQLMWPQGNPTFCETVWTYAKVMEDVEKTVRRMVLESLGLNHYYDSVEAAAAYYLRLTRYGGPVDEDTKVALGIHKDPNMLTVICRPDAGLEVQGKDGEYFAVAPSPNSVNVMVGEALEAWTNKRLKAPPHLVRMQSNYKRFSTIFDMQPRDGHVVQAPDELVDEKHPRIYKPYDYNDYERFRYSEAGSQYKDTLFAFSGLAQDKVVA